MIKLRERFEAFAWRVRNRRFWNRGKVKHWWDWFTLHDGHTVPQYKMWKYKRWLKQFDSVS